MKITYFGHSCFRFEKDGYSIVIDPYRGVSGYAPLHTSADMVLCSHEHADHNAVECVRRSVSGKENPFGITMMQTYHDDRKGTLRGENLVHIVTDGSKTVVHLGDLGHDLPEGMLEHIRNCDCLMIPVGGFYTLSTQEAWRLARRINPAVLVPMHYRSGPYGYRELAPLTDFLKDADRRIAVTKSPTFEIPDQRENILLIPATKE